MFMIRPTEFFHQFGYYCVAEETKEYQLWLGWEQPKEECVQEPSSKRAEEGQGVTFDVRCWSFGQSDDKKPEDRARQCRHFLIFGFCGSQIFWIWGSQMLAIDEPEDRARPKRVTDNCICATVVVRALCCSKEEPGEVNWMSYNKWVAVNFQNCQVSLKEPLFCQSKSLQWLFYQINQVEKRPTQLPYIVEAELSSETRPFLMNDGSNWAEILWFRIGAPIIISSFRWSIWQQALVNCLHYYRCKMVWHWLFFACACHALRAGQNLQKTGFRSFARK